MNLSDLIQYAVIAAIAGYSLWRLARPYLKRSSPSSEEGNCGSGDGCGACKGCGALSESVPSEPSARR